MREAFCVAVAQLLLEVATHPAIIAEFVKTPDPAEVDRLQIATRR